LAYHESTHSSGRGVPRSGNELPADEPTADGLVIVNLVFLNNIGNARGSGGKPFVAGPESSFINGANLTVDGGVNA
jgi:hypothetical protein